MYAAGKRVAMCLAGRPHLLLSLSARGPGSCQRLAGPLPLILSPRQQRHPRIQPCQSTTTDYVPYIRLDVQGIH